MYTTNAVQTHNRCRYTRRRVRLRTDILNTDVRRRIVESSKNQLFSSHSACSRVSASKPFELTRASHVYIYAYGFSRSPHSVLPIRREIRSRRPPCDAREIVTGDGNRGARRANRRRHARRGQTS